MGCIYFDLLKVLELVTNPMVESVENHKKIKQKCTEIGRSPAPVDMVNIPLFIGFHTSQVVPDFSHQQYHSGLKQISLIPSRWASTIGMNGGH